VASEYKPIGNLESTAAGEVCDFLIVTLAAPLLFLLSASVERNIGLVALVNLLFLCRRDAFVLVFYTVDFLADAGVLSAR
jgi:hypothetical protein